MSPTDIPLTVAGDGTAEERRESPPAMPAPPVVDHRTDLLESRIKNTIDRLYEKNAAALLRYGLAVCGDVEIARDAVQEAFIRYYIALRNATTTGDPKGWLYSTTRNYILDRLKGYYYRNGQRLEATFHLTQDADNPESQVLIREINATAYRLLSPRELECLRLRSEGLRYRDIADVLKIESTTVGVLLARALRKIRAAINGQEKGT